MNLRGFLSRLQMEGKGREGKGTGRDRKGQEERTGKGILGIFNVNEIQISQPCPALANLLLRFDQWLILQIGVWPEHL